MRIHLFLVRIRILDPYWEKMYLDPDIYLRFTNFFNRRLIFRYIFLTFFTFFMQQLDVLLRADIFDNLSFFNSSDLSFSFWLLICPWNRIRGSAYFCGSGSSKPKCCGFNRILSTDQLN